MKKILIVCLAWLVCGACTKNWQIMETEDVNEKSSTKSSTLETVEVKLEIAGTLEEKLADKKEKVEKLIVSGPFNAIDVGFMRSLAKLKALDMKNVTIVGGDATYHVAYEHLQEDVSLQDNIIGQYMFYNLHLEELILPINITAIGDAALENNDFETIELPETLVSLVGSRNIRGCTKLKKITLPTGIQTLPNECFAGCASLSEVNLPQGLKKIGHVAFGRCTSLASITLPQGLNTIGRGCFALSGLQSIVIPKSVTDIQSGANYEEGPFVGCKDLQSVTILSTEIKEVGCYWFKGCTSLTSVELPEQIEKITQGTFTGCSSLSEIRLPKNLKDIYFDAFKDCVALKSVQYSDNLQRIGNRAFFNTGFSTLNLPKTLVQIESLAFASCEQLESVVIPSNVSLVEKGAFAQCYNLHSIFWNTSATIPPMYQGKSVYGDVVSGGNPNCLLYLSDENTKIDDKDWKNIILKGLANRIVLSSEKGTFYCPQEFKTMQISYTYDFQMKTYPHESAGWRGISLPFTVMHIAHEDGRALAPFNSDTKDCKYFWLRRLTNEGFQNVTSIEANIPYILAMPNYEKYAPEYNIVGKVIFSAENYSEGITIPVTQELLQDVGPQFKHCSNYKCQPRNVSIYALNKNVVGQYNPGGAFVHSERDVMPFETYVANKTVSAQMASSYPVSSDVNTRGVSEVGDFPKITDM